MYNRNNIVADGRKRAMNASKDTIAQIRQRIKKTVKVEYSQRLANAGFFKRIFLKMEMQREINRCIAAEIEKIAPRNGLYIANRK